MSSSTSKMLFCDETREHNTGDHTINSLLYAEVNY